MDFQDSWSNISLSSFVILAASIFDISRGKTDRHTDAGENPTPATAGVGFTVLSECR